MSAPFDYVPESSGPRGLSEATYWAEFNADTYEEVTPVEEPDDTHG